MAAEERRPEPPVTVRRSFAPGLGVAFWLGLVAAALCMDFFLTGIHSIQQNEQGVVLRFGAVARRAPPGLVFTLPWPVEELVVLNTRETRKMPVGFRFVQGADPTPPLQDESQWLTGDTNVIDVELILHYTISDPVKYLFRVGPVYADFLIRKCAETVLTETVGVLPVDVVLTTGKAEIEEKTCRMAQEMLDKFQAGVSISRASLQKIAPPAEVSDAFKDVSSAKADRERALQEADGYRREIMPQARARAAQIEEEAKIYASKVLSEARGKAERFKSLYAEYAKAPVITRTRLLLDTLREVLARPRKIVVNTDASGKASVKIVPR